ncbi:tyrosine recombinase XerC [Coleofasciculus sp. H7-2]|uniref:site-specific integrase n=1 Tax=Coleofasciculus sp. H7-2 TaxID=3351545 RepID=UPI00366C7307
MFEQANGTWRGKVTVGYTEDGKQRFRWVSGKTQAEALAKVAEIKQRLASGTFSDTKLTVKSYLEQWLDEKARHVKPSTVDTYRRLSTVHIIPKVGRKGLDKLTPLDVQNLMGELADSTGVRTANACRTLLFSAYKQAIRWQLVARNPVEATDPLRAAHKDTVLWSGAQAAHFLDSARPHRLYAAFYLVMATGLRRGELLGLRWEDVSERELYIRQQLTYREGAFVFAPPKTAQGTRRIAITPDVYAVLEAHRRAQEAQRADLGEMWPNTGLVFVSEVGTPIHPRNFERSWGQLKKAANMPPARLHDLRHLHVSLLVKQGVDPQAIADRVGHSDASFTLRRYSHMFEEHRERTAISLATLLGVSMTGQTN